MPVMDEFREEREALKHSTPKEKAAYFWDYYKWHTIVGIIVICCAVSIAHYYLTLKDVALYVAMLNCSDLEIDENSKPFSQSYAEYAGIDLEDYDLTFNTNLFIGTDDDHGAAVSAIYGETSTAVMEKLMVSMAAAELDVMMGGGEAFAYYANGSVFCDMHTILSPEQAARYESDFYYIDAALTEQRNEMSADSQAPSTLEFPDPRKPELMEKPVPVGIYIDKDRISGYYYFRDVEDGLVLGILDNSTQRENALSFVDYLMEEN